MKDNMKEEIRSIIAKEKKRARKEAEEVKNYPSDYLREETKGYYRGVSTLGRKIENLLDGR